MLLSCHLGENFSFNRAGFERNPLNHVRVEEIEASINLIADKSRGFLDKSLDFAVFFRDDDSVLGGVLNLGHDDCALPAVVQVELNELVERVLTDDIRVENEEQTLYVLVPDYLLGQADGTGCAQRLRL